jgi:hypothetical protein
MLRALCAFWATSTKKIMQNIHSEGLVEGKSLIGITEVTGLLGDRPRTGTSPEGPHRDFLASGS